jgi:predicted phosphodiesterase
VTFADEVRDDGRLQAKVDAQAAEIGSLRRALAAVEAENDTLRRVADASKRALDPPRWLRPKRKPDGHVGTVCVILSDCHFDESVNPAEVDGRNAYSREIAEQRLERFFTNTVKVTRDYMKGIAFDGAVLFLGGDLVSGTIHDEITQSNEAYAPETALHWADPLAAGIGLLADTYGKVHVPCVSGNHGRLTRKPRAKGRTRDNWDWLIAQLLAKHFKDDERVTFQIPDSTDALVTVYDTTYLLTHGDQVTGGSGIGGIWPPIMRMVTRKRTRYQFDTIVMGHFHQLIQAPDQGLIVNGSLKGFDEYAAVSNVPPERAQQALWVTTPEHGCTFQAPVLVVDREAEGW